MLSGVLQPYVLREVAFWEPPAQFNHSAREARLQICALFPAGALLLRNAEWLSGSRNRQSKVEGVIHFLSVYAKRIALRGFSRPS